MEVKGPQGDHRGQEFEIYTRCSGVDEENKRL